MTEEAELTTDFFIGNWGWRCPCGTSADGSPSEAEAYDAQTKHKRAVHGDEP